MYKSDRISTNEIVFTIKRIKDRASEFHGETRWKNVKSAKTDFFIEAKFLKCSRNKTFLPTLVIQTYNTFGMNISRFFRRGIKRGEAVTLVQVVPG